VHRRACGSISAGQKTSVNHISGNFTLCFRYSGKSPAEVAYFLGLNAFFSSQRYLYEPFVRLCGLLSALVATKKYKSLTAEDAEENSHENAEGKNRQ